MFEPLALRDELAAPGLVVVRLGARTLDDELARRSVEECDERWGIWGFSVLEVPGGDFERLVRMRPIVADRRQFLVADGESHLSRIYRKLGLRSRTELARVPIADQTDLP